MNKASSFVPLSLFFSLSSFYISFFSFFFSFFVVVFVCFVFRV